MRLLIIEPVVFNGLSLEENRAYFASVADPSTELEIVHLERGPRSIETFYDAEHASPEILRLIRRRAEEVDAIVINCFADPALDAARELSDRVVLGAGEAGMSVALHLGAKFSVISLSANTSYWVRLQVLKLGVESRLAAAVGVDVTVEDLRRASEEALAKIVSAAHHTIVRDGAEVIVLGCTGMVGLAAALREAIAVPVVEPAAAAIKMAEMLVKLGLRHHRGGAFLPPDFGKIVGY